MRALTLCYNGRAEVIETYEEEVHSPSITINKPAVIRLLRYFKRKIFTARFTKNAVVARDRSTCMYCSQMLGSHEITFDHIIPLSKGGKSNEWENIVTACKYCNQKKGARTPEQAGMKLVKKPTVPTYMLGVDAAFQYNGGPEQWRAYLYI